MRFRSLVVRAVLAAATLGVVADASPAAIRRHPFAAARPVPPSEANFSGRVLERLPAGSYVYLRVERADGTTDWVVTMEVLAPTVERVRVHVVRRSAHFDSPRLKRSFSPLLFAVVTPQRGDAP